MQSLLGGADLAPALNESASDKPFLNTYAPRTESGAPANETGLHCAVRRVRAAAASTCSRTRAASRHGVRCTCTPTAPTTIAPATMITRAGVTPTAGLTNAIRAIAQNAADR